MNNSTELRTCTICREPKLDTEFYMQHTGKRNPVCVPCFLKRHKAYIKKTVNLASQPHEQRCIDYMRSLGIYTAPGKASEFSWVDLVAWGFIKIEVKLGLDTTGDENWIFKFSTTQIKKRLLADVVVFIIPNETWEYYVFDPKHPAFYKNGRLKTGVQYLPNAKHRKHLQDSIPLTSEIMNAARDDWTILLDKMPDLRVIRNRVIGTAIENMEVKGTQKVLI